MVTKETINYINHGLQNTLAKKVNLTIQAKFIEIS